MSTVVGYRNGYFAVSGAPALAVPYSSFWTDTSEADSVGGVWDAASASGFDTVGGAWTLGSSTPTKKVLLRQYVFPAFGGMEFALGDVSLGGSRYWGVAGGTDPSRAPAPVSRARAVSVVNGSGVSVIGSTILQTRLYAKVVNASTVERSAKSSATGPELRSVSVLTGVLYQPSYPVASTYQPQATDLLVIELGFFLQRLNTAGGTWTFSLEAEFGDSGSGWDVSGSTTQRNAGLTFTHFVTATGGDGSGARWVKPLAPTMAAKRIEDPPVDAGGPVLNDFFLN